MVKQKVGANTSNTPAQQRQRLRWAKMADLEALFEEASVIGFPGRPKACTPNNIFRQLNTNSEVVEVSDALEVTVNYPRICCAKGRLKLPASVAVSREGGDNSLAFSIGAEENGTRRQVTDVIHVLVVETVLEEALLAELGSRGDGGIKTVELQEGWSMDNLAIYLFVVSADGKRASVSKYLELA